MAGLDARSSRSPIHCARLMFFQPLRHISAQLKKGPNFFTKG